jgi:transcriptional regulator with XRE-family HTH domain
MTTKRIRFDAQSRADAAEALEALRGGPLTFGRHLRAIRLGEEMTQLEMARRLSVSKAHLSDIENDRKVVSIERAARWGKKLGYHPTDFVRLALADAVRRAGLPYRVTVEEARGG